MPLRHSQDIPKLIPEDGSPPVLASTNPLSTLHRRFACARFSQPCLLESCPGVSAALTTITFDDGSLRWFEIKHLMPTSRVLLHLWYRSAPSYSDGARDTRYRTDLSPLKLGSGAIDEID
jgi:hypothetical protein